MWSVQWCVCSFYARVEFWRDFVTIARRVFCTVELPIVIASGANIWHPRSNLGLSRYCDNTVIPFVDFLMVSCQLRLCNQSNQATHRFDCIFISTSWMVMIVAQLLLIVAHCWDQTISCVSLMD